jgi:hypothetical protein
VAAGTAAVKETPATINEQTSVAHDLRGCEETLEHINSCLDKESERFVCISSIFKRHGHKRIILNGLGVLSWDSDGLWARWLGFDSWQEKDFSLLHGI